MKTQPIIEFAVVSCLAQCSEAQLPMTTLSDYMAKLKEQGWDDESLEKFRAAVMNALSERPI